MHRDPVEEHDVLTWLDEQLVTRPGAGFVAAVTEFDAETGGVKVQIGDVGCNPIDLVIIASEVLETAAVMAKALPPSEAALGLARSIALGLRCLDLTAPTATA